MHLVFKFGVSFVAIACIAARFYLNWYEREVTPVRKEICEVVFTNPSSKCCFAKRKDQACPNAYCMKKAAGRIIHYIDSAKSSICLAMNIFTYTPFLDALVRAHKRGIIVRVVFDGTMSGQTGSNRRKLAEHGKYLHSKHRGFCHVS